jgi:hypothetical protein
MSREGGGEGGETRGPHMEPTSPCPYPHPHTHHNPFTYSVGAVTGSRYGTRLAATAEGG